MAGIVIQVIAYSFIAVFKLSDFAIHPFFFDVMLIAFASIAVQIGGFVVIMSKTKDADPVIYGQGRPFQHKLREEDEDLATRKPTFAE
ncbi:MAG: hypothetical protein JSW05_03830 [Candidatus Thorarchaeota archaeon]|nr:MAG: hypothetical protein JSW05_03830 [Candidatus Thorarchaeota archaeon]